MSSSDAVDETRSGDGFLGVVGALSAELTTEDYWKNTNLDDYLLACCAWALDSIAYEQQEQSLAPTEVTWQFLAAMLAAGTVYE